ncbi:MAG: FtsQ-type POTRA domain-containing protein [Peptococcaceae bacterium]|nr:FtsQ-type POTRA domain-containing protein [Peptococcaceae bacterium]
MSGRPSRYNFLQSVFFIVLILTAAYVLARSPVFEVREIRVAGNSSLTPETIISASGINQGENIFKLDLKSSAGKLKSIPLVKSVEMARRLPSTVEIKVEERKPRALLPVGDGFIQVDEDGVCLQKGDLAGSQLPVVTGVNFSAPAPGGQIKSEALDRALAVVMELPAGLLPMLSEVNVSGDQFVAYTLDGIQCRLGMPGDIGQKGEVLMKVLNELKVKGKRIEYIDLSYTGSPVVKYAE